MPECNGSPWRLRSLGRRLGLSPLSGMCRFPYPLWPGHRDQVAGEAAAKLTGILRRPGQVRPLPWLCPRDGAGVLRRGCSANHEGDSSAAGQRSASFREPSANEGLENRPTSLPPMRSRHLPHLKHAVVVKPSLNRIARVVAPGLTFEDELVLVAPAVEDQLGRELTLRIRAGHRLL